MSKNYSDFVKVKIDLWQAIKFGLGFGLGLLFYDIIHQI